MILWGLFIWSQQTNQYQKLLTSAAFSLEEIPSFRMAQAEKGAHVLFVRKNFLPTSKNTHNQTYILQIQSRPLCINPYVRHELRKVKEEHSLPQSFCAILCYICSARCVCFVYIYFLGKKKKRTLNTINNMQTKSLYDSEERIRKINVSCQRLQLKRSVQ